MGKVTRQILTIENPRLAREWCYEKNDGLRPEDFTGASNKIVWWECKRGHAWPAMINNRTKGQKCPYCTGRKVLAGFNDLTTVSPKIADEWDYEKNKGLRPEQLTGGSKEKVWWKCALGHSWEAAIYSRKKHDCPHCYGNILTPGANDLLTVNPQLAAEWDYEKNEDLRPENVAANTAAKAWWRCDKNHSWQAKISNRNHGADCPYCTNRWVLKGFNDLLTIDPILCKEWDYEKNKKFRPDEVTYKSGKYAWWKCERGHSWRTAVAWRRQNGKITQCPYCAGKFVIPGETDLKTLRPDLADEWDYDSNKGKRPEEFTCGSNKRVFWKCKCGYRFRTAICSRTSGTKCPRCNGKTHRRTRFV